MPELNKLLSASLTFLCISYRELENESPHTTILLVCFLFIFFSTRTSSKSCFRCVYDYVRVRRHKTLIFLFNFPSLQGNLFRVPLSLLVFAPLIMRHILFFSTHFPSIHLCGANKKRWALGAAAGCGGYLQFKWYVRLVCVWGTRDKSQNSKMNE